jgi:hypothetical protein
VVDRRRDKIKSEVWCPECGTSRMVGEAIFRDIKMGRSLGRCKSCALKGNTYGQGDRKLYSPLARQLFGTGRTHTSFYNTWVSIRQRCTNPSYVQWNDYGGRGITVCDRWNDFENFVTDMYPSFQEGLTIDRIDNDGPYSPDNCRWATRLVQNNNRRNNRLLTHDGLTMNVAQWARHIGITYSALHQRLGKGWPLERALTP